MYYLDPNLEVFMDPLSKLILESVDQDMLVDVSGLWNRIWKLGYPRHAIESQAKKLGLEVLPIQEPFSKE